MTLRLNGSTSGYTEIDAPAVAGSNLITLPSGNGSANQFLKNGSTAGSLGWSSMVETATGVGIGTSSPGAPLSLGSNNQSTTDRACSIRLYDVGGTNGNNYGFGFDGNAGGFYYTAGTGGFHAWLTANTERMRIDSNGNVGINVTNPSAGASATSGVAFRPGSHDVWFNHANGVSSGTVYTYFAYNSGAIGSISQNGTTAVAYNTTSDYRLKENVTAVTNGIVRLQQLKPCKFNFISEPDRTVDGFIAHEVQQVIPEAITGEKDAVDADGKPIYQGIDQSKLVPLLTAALQEAIGRIETLEANNAALEARLTALEVTP